MQKLKKKKAVTENSVVLSVLDVCDLPERIYENPALSDMTRK